VSGSGSDRCWPANEDRDFMRAQLRALWALHPESPN